LVAGEEIHLGAHDQVGCSLTDPGIIGASFEAFGKRDVRRIRFKVILDESNPL
jgi:hypothetical protein